MGVRRPYGEGNGFPDEPEHEEWEDEDNPNPYAPDDQSEDPGDLTVDERDADGDEDDEDPEDELEEERNTRPWADPRAGVVGRPREGLVASIQDAMDRIRDARAEFLYDCDESAGSAYLLAGVPTRDGVGPHLAAGIHLALEDAGIRVLRHGVRPGVARNGRKYHYFFRVERRDGTLPRRDAVRAALRRESPPPKTDAPTAPSAAVEHISDATLESVHAELRHALSRAADAERRSLGILHIQDRRLIGYRRRLAETESLVRDILQKVPEPGARGVDPATLTAKLRHVEERLQQRNQEIESALAIADEQETRAKGLEDELAWYRGEYQQLVARLGARDAHEQNAVGEDSLGDRDDVVAQLLPEVSFVRDSVAVLWNETDRVGWLRDLALLVHDHERFVTEIRRRGYIEHVEGQSDWTEVRRTRSARDRSRLYYTDKLTTARRRLCTSEHKWLVRLCIKTDRTHQRRDIESLP